MADIDPKALRPGTVVRHRDGSTVVLARRKDDDSGWWNTDTSGLADRVFTDGDWMPAREASCGLCGAVVIDGGLHAKWHGAIMRAIDYAALPDRMRR